LMDLVRRSDLSVCWPKLSQLEKAEFAHHYFVTVGSDLVSISGQDKKWGMR
jgi:hypothetical protein